MENKRKRRGGKKSRIGNQSLPPEGPIRAVFELVLQAQGGREREEGRGSLTSDEEREDGGRKGY